MWRRQDGHEELQQHLSELYGFFYQTNDRAHRLPHMISVSETAVEINTQLNLGLDNCILVGAAMVHDLFNHSRDNHHEMAKLYIQTNPIPWLQEFSPIELEKMACAAGEHRASYKGEYSSIYSEIVAAADRGMPNVKSAVIRCAVYGADKCNFRGVALYNHTMSHMKEKFGTAGYARYPDIYTKFYSESLTKFQHAMETLSPTVIDELVADHPVAKLFK